nr:hypothetical protein [Pontiella sulfatireligans]
MAGFLTTEEEEVLFADGGRANGVLDEVIADFECAMFEVKIERIPTFDGVIDRFTEVALRELERFFLIEDFLYLFEMGLGMCLAYFTSLR